jgi:plastocyanin
MALQAAIEGATHTGQTVTWQGMDGTAHDLTGATLSGTIRDEDGTERAIDGTLTIISPTQGTFTWAYGTNDIAEAGHFEVQFRATYPDGKYDLSFIEPWRVEKAL